ncbi:MAG: FMN-binding negative transcriptional regulator [Spirochaetales bacterium]
MYQPPAYEVTDETVLFDLIRKYPLGTLVANAGGELEANHLPFVVVQDGGKRYLLAHVARANPDWPQFHDGDKVLVLFRGEQGYVSPNWYPSKQQSEDQVPTWNYQVVHVRGRISVVDTPRFVRGVVARLITQNEATQPHPWKLTDSSPDFVAGELQKIVGLKVEIESLVGKFKLSQNRSDTDLRGAIHGLRGVGKDGLAGAMEKAIEKATHARPRA